MSSPTIMAQSVSSVAAEKPYFSNALRVSLGRRCRPRAPARSAPRSARGGPGVCGQRAAQAWFGQWTWRLAGSRMPRFPWRSADAYHCGIDSRTRDEDPLTAVARKQLPLRPAGPDTVAALLDWYDARAARSAVARARPGKRADPYRVWLSEIMLQQTTVKAVIPFYLRFLQRWPTVEALAAADLDDVLAAWAGLGYYSRARNLHKCAQAVADELGGRFPESEAELQQLPGIGPYTAAAIAAIAFGAAGDARRRQRRARGGAAVCRAPAAARRQGRAEAPCRDADAEAAARRLCAGDDGPRRQHLHAAPSLVPRLPAADGLRRPRARASQETLPLRWRQARAAAARRHRVRRLARGRPRAAARAPRRGCWAACWRCRRRRGAIFCRRPRRRCAPRRCAPTGGRCPARSCTPSRTSGWRLVVYRALVPADADAHLLGRARALPLGGAPRSRRVGAAERHAQSHRPRPARELARPLRRAGQQLGDPRRRRVLLHDGQHGDGQRHAHEGAGNAPQQRREEHREHHEKRRDRQGAAR